MTAAEFFYISASLAIWIVVISWLFIAWKVGSLIHKATSEMQSVKTTLKLGFLNAASKLLGGGDKNGKK